MKKPLIFIWFILLLYPVRGQDLERQIDLNYQKYKESVYSNTDSALIYIIKAESLNKKLDDPDWSARINYGLGYTYSIIEDYSRAQDYFKKAIRYAQITDNLNILSKAYNQLGVSYYMEGDFKNALENFHNSLKISEKKEEFSENTMSVYSNLANLYINQKDTVNARIYYHNARRMGERDNQKYILAGTFNNLAVSYMGSNKDSTEYYLNKAIDIYKETHNTYWQISTQLNLASTYLNFKSEKDYPKALELLNNSLNLSKAIQNADSEFYSFLYLGNYYEQAENDYEKARYYYNQAYQLIKEGYKTDSTIELYRLLSRVNSKLGDYSAAYDFQKDWHRLQDSVFSVERNKQFVEIQTRYGVERKNTQIQLLEKEKEVQQERTRLIVIVAILLIITAIVFAMFYRARLKLQKTIREQDQVIFEKERETISAKNLIKGQNQERKRIAGELHDGVGGKLSAIKIKMDQLNMTSIRNEELKECIDQLQETAKEIRLISHELNENKIKELSFVNLLQHLISDYKLYFPGEIHFNVFPENKFNEIDGYKKHYLYRSIQEIFNNSIKYAKAENIYVDCTYDGVYRLIIEDDGVGFDINKIKRGMGLNNLEERVKSMGGEFHIDSAVGRGSTFVIEVP